MSMNEIIISIDSFHSRNKHDIIASNNHYVTRLFQNNLTEDKISEDALKSYYIDYYLSHIQHGGFSAFIKAFSNKPKILYYIASGLETLGAGKHLALFNKVFFEENNFLAKNILDKEFNTIQESENLLHLNHNWLMNHPQLIIMHHDYIEKKIQEHIQKHKEEKRHVKIIKQLCEIIDEEFIAVTAGDINNIYHRAWHFKTTKGRYYMIEKNNIVTLYNSFTKKEITKGRVVSNQTKGFTLSGFISQMLA
jgi:hypothetical protein